MHHNYYDDKAQGYFSMYNPSDKNSSLIAKRLSNAIADNGLVKQRECQPNTGYIGELNGLNNTTTGVLLELGFFSNGEELKNICSHEYVKYVSIKLADELTKILNEQYR
jgi:N-acetylmuramoyl-L-alanine amidase